MELAWYIYLIQVVENVICLSQVIMIITGIIAVAMGVGFLIQTSDGDDIQAKLFGLWLKRLLITLAIGAFIVVFTPNRRTLLLAAAVKYTPVIAQSETVQGIVNPGIELLKTWIAKETDRMKQRATK